MSESKGPRVVIFGLNQGSWGTFQSLVIYSLKKPRNAMKTIKVTVCMACTQLQIVPQDGATDVFACMW